MNDLHLITALMRENSEAVGFIPSTTIEQRYIKQGQYIVQTNSRGQGIGYLLHGKPTPGGILSVTQHCIEYDQRLKGHGRETFETLIERARQANCRAIKVRCASDLPSIEFWRAMGLEITNVEKVQNTRQRDINIMLLDLWPTLWGKAA